MRSKTDDATMLTYFPSQDTAKVFGGCRSTCKFFMGGERWRSSIITNYIGIVRAGRDENSETFALQHVKLLSMGHW